MFWSHLWQCSLYNILGGYSKYFTCVGLCTDLIWMVVSKEALWLCYMHTPLSTTSLAIILECCCWCIIALWSCLSCTDEAADLTAKQFLPIRMNAIEDVHRALTDKYTGTVYTVQRMEGGSRTFGRCWLFKGWFWSGSLFQKILPASSVRLNAHCKSLLCFAIHYMTIMLFRNAFLTDSRVCLYVPVVLKRDLHR